MADEKYLFLVGECVHFLFPQETNFGYNLFFLDYKSKHPRLNSLTAATLAIPLNYTFSPLNLSRKAVSFGVTSEYLIKTASEPL